MHPRAPACRSRAQPRARGPGCRSRWRRISSGRPWPRRGVGWSERFSAPLGVCGKSGLAPVHGSDARRRLLSWALQLSERRCVLKRPKVACEAVVSDAAEGDQRRKKGKERERRHLQSTRRDIVRVRALGRVPIRGLPALCEPVGDLRPPAAADGAAGGAHVARIRREGCCSWDLHNMIEVRRNESERGRQGDGCTTP